MLCLYLSFCVDQSSMHERKAARIEFVVWYLVPCANVVALTSTETNYVDFSGHNSSRYASTPQQ